jgi:DNA modification methylase
MAGCPVGGLVLDPFTGSGTVGLVALRHERNFLGFELNPEYAKMARERIGGDLPMFNQESVTTLPGGGFE